MASQLSELPLEIHERIASSCSASGALALAQTCRSLRASCWDHIVFLDIIAASPSNWDFERLLPGPPSRPHSKWDTLEVAKFALADEYACDLRGGLAGEFKGHCFDQALKWAPQLIVGQHPFTSSPWLALKLSEVIHGVLLDLRGVFCYTAAMLGTDDDGNDMVATSQEALRQLPEDVMKARTRWKALRALGAFAVLLRQEIKKNKIHQRPHRQWTAHAIEAPADIDPSFLHGRRQFLIQEHNWNAADIQRSITRQLADDEADSIPLIKPPSAVDIPMKPTDKSYAFPVPFSNLTQRQIVEGEKSIWEKWHDAHVAAMCMPYSLKSGSWEGYFLDRRHQSLFVDPGFYPMVDIEFDRVFEKVHARATSAEDYYGTPKPTLEVRGHGRDAIGPFQLTGTIESKGKVLIKKEYGQQNSHWYWQLSMTPFGMFGTWGPRDGFHVNVAAQGAVWLWKKEWSPRRDTR